MESPDNGIVARWSATLASCGDHPAIQGPDGSVLRTFTEVATEAGRIENLLGGCKRGDVVALQGANAPWWLAAFVAIRRLGAVVLLEDSSLQEGIRSNVESLCGASARISCGGLTRLSNNRPPDLPDAAAVIKLTSGTTGLPRAILFAESQLIADCDAVCDTMKIHRDDLNYGVVAFSHSYGFSNLVTPLICRGIPVVVTGDALPRAILKGLATTGATVLPTVPAIFSALAALGGDLARVRLCVSAGAPLPSRVADQFFECFGRKIHSFYGASECGGICYDAGDGSVAGEGYVGTPLRGVNLQFNPVTGHLAVAGPSVGLGIFPPSPNDKLRDGVFHPQDRVVRDGSGFRIVGRDGDWINVAGRKLDPTEVENVLLANPLVRDAVVVAREDSRRSEAAAAIVVVDENHSPDLRAILRNHCASHLAPWKIPRWIATATSIPTGSRGKRSRSEIATWAAKSNLWPPNQK